MTEAELIAEQMRADEERREEMRREKGKYSISAPLLLVGYFGGMALAAIAVVAAIVWVISGVFGAAQEPSLFEKFQTVWDGVPPSDQDVICLNWDVYPNTTATAMGERLGGDESIGSTFLRYVCD